MYPWTFLFSLGKNGISWKLVYALREDVLGEDDGGRKGGESEVQVNGYREMLRSGDKFFFMVMDFGCTV